MKISPLASGQAGSPSTNVHGAAEVGSASPDRIARAKAIAAGESEIQVMQSDTPQENKPDVRKIVMKTNVSPDRDISLAEVENLVESTSTATSEVPPVIGETKPLDPQFAALAKQRRALQAKERELTEKAKALEAQSTSVGVETLTARLKSEPLSVLQEYGVTYDQLTEAILANQNGITPEINKLKAEVKALKEGVDKTLADKDAQAEKQVLSEIRREAEKMGQSDDFEMVRSTNSYPEVVELIHRIYKETGEILDVSEAMQLVEDDLITESLKLANTKKVKSRLTPAQANKVQQQLPSQQKQIKTLTNRDTAKPVQSRRDRAIAAALGNLKR